MYGCVCADAYAHMKSMFIYMARRWVLPRWFYIIYYIIFFFIVYIRMYIYICIYIYIMQILLYSKNNQTLLWATIDANMYIQIH